MSAQPRRSHGAQQEDRELEALLGAVISDAGYDLEDVNVTPAGRRRLVRVVVDGDEGVSLDNLATVSHQVSSALDASDVLDERPYVLEVTSPGVDRPLTEPRHWRRAAGRIVRVPLTSGGEVTGRVVSADDRAVVIGDVSYPYTDLGRGRVQLEFRRDNDEQGGER